MYSSCGKSEEPYAPLIKIPFECLQWQNLCCTDSCKQYFNRIYTLARRLGLHTLKIRPDPCKRCLRVDFHCRLILHAYACNIYATVEIHLKAAFTLSAPALSPSTVLTWH